MKENKNNPGNYFKALDGKLWDVLSTSGDQDLGEFDASGGTYLKQDYAAGELPLTLVSKATGFTLTSGLCQQRLAQLVEAGLIIWRKNGTGKPSFLSLAVTDHDSYFRGALSSRIKYVEGLRANLSVIIGQPVMAHLDSFATRPERYEALLELLTAGGRQSEISAYWKAYKKLRPMNGR